MPTTWPGSSMQEGRELLTGGLWVIIDPGPGHVCLLHGNSMRVGKGKQRNKNNTIFQVFIVHKVYINWDHWLGKASLKLFVGLYHSSSVSDI